MKIKQGSVETPLKMGEKKTQELEGLLQCAGEYVKAQQNLGEMRAQVIERFERLRPALEAKHGLHETYSVLNAAGAIAVTLGGRSFALKDKFTDSAALHKFLEENERLDLADFFKFSASPIQKEVKNHMDDATLRRLGDMKDSAPSVSLKAGTAD